MTLRPSMHIHQGLIPLVAALLLVCCTATAVNGQIYETICRDANCTDVALGPIALLPNCYRTQSGSISLRLNESDSDVVELCFYNADDCFEDDDDDFDFATNRTVERTCHTFFNDETCDCPFLRGMNDTGLYIKFSWDSDAMRLLIDAFDMLASHSTSKRQLRNLFGLADYGNWCGPGHSGVTDCCDDEPCSQCNYSQGLTSQCLNQCPVRDQLDYACAVHDYCTTIYDYERVLPSSSNFECEYLFGTRTGEYCPCNCQLVQSAQNIRNTNRLYRSAVIFTFTHLTDCWYNSPSGPVCNSGRNQILVTEFC